MARGLRQLRVIVALDGAAPILSTIAVAPADQLALMDTAVASLLPGPDGLPSLLIVQLSQAPVIIPPEPDPVSPAPSPVPLRIKLTTEDGRVLTSEDGVPLVLPDMLTDGP